MPSQNRILNLTVVTTDRDPIKAECDSVHLTISDDKKGRGGGSYGIHHGHAPALLSLADGTIEAMSDGKCILKLQCSGGFARVDGESVTAVVEKIIS